MLLHLVLLISDSFSAFGNFPAGFRLEKRTNPTALGFPLAHESEAEITKPGGKSFNLLSVVHSYL